MRRSVLFWFLIAIILLLLGFGLPAQAYIPVGDMSEIDSIVLTVAPSYGSIEELTNSVTVIRPTIGTVRVQTIWQKDDTVQHQQLFIAQSEDVAALVSSLYEHDFFGMPEYFETDVLDGDFTWITVNLRGGESKRAGGLLAEEYGPEGFIAICNATDQVMHNLLAYQTYAGMANSDDANGIRLGQDISITVDENETTPYRWLPVLTDETVMELVGEAYIQDPNPLGLCGVGGNHRFDFRAIGVGVCSIDMYLVRIGDTIEEAVQKESYIYVVEEDQFTHALATNPPSEDTPVSVSIGETIQFGGYSWLVLEVQEGKALLITEEIIEANLYHLELTDVTWETCFLRSYLNGIFLRKFSDEEQERILETCINNPGNLWYGTPGGADTNDKVFLLSLEEVDRYFGDSGDYHNERRKRWRVNGIEENDDGWAFSNTYDGEREATFGYGPSWWWLRSPGSVRPAAATVNAGGSVNVSGRDVDTIHPDMGGVRPVLWLSLEAVENIPNEAEELVGAWRTMEDDGGSVTLLLYPADAFRLYRYHAEADETLMLEGVRVIEGGEIIVSDIRLGILDSDGVYTQNGEKDTIRFTFVLELDGAPVLTLTDEEGGTITLYPVDLDGPG